MDDGSIMNGQPGEKDNILLVKEALGEGDRKENCEMSTTGTDKKEPNTTIENGGPDIRPQFGNRYLKDSSKVFEHNAWDDVEWDEELEEEARQKITLNSSEHVDQEKCEHYEQEADRYWNDFYDQHQNKFFKDRHWLFTEFAELAPQDWNGPEKCSKDGEETQSPEVESQSGFRNSLDNEDEERLVVGFDVASEYPGAGAQLKIFEAGCGVGNTIFPILQTNNNPELFVYCCDFAESAITIVKEHELYDKNRCHAFVCDVAGEDPDFPFPEESMDIVVLIFVLSAINPDRMSVTLKRLSKLLKPGGLFLFRDYGRYDMAQLRFKKGRCLSENFYVRGDGTRVYFFTQDELDGLLTECGLVKEQNLIDRRLQVNRGRQLKMYRVWIQCKYRKPHPDED